MVSNQWPGFLSHPCCVSQVSLGEFELKAPVTIRLRSGTGPVTVSGLHLIGEIVNMRSTVHNEGRMAILIDSPHTHFFL